MAKCRSAANGGGVDVYSPDGTKYEFGWYQQVAGKNTYSITKIVDRNDNNLVFHYGSSSSHQQVILESITSSDGRTATFTYINKTKWEALLTKISSGGRSVQYDYKQLTDNGVNVNGYFYMKWAKRPDGHQYDYEYYESRPISNLAGLFSLKTAKNPGKVVTTYSYQLVTFDPGVSTLQTTAIKTKGISAGGVTSGTWTYSFNPGSSRDKTTINTPNGKEEYWHKGAQSAVDGKVWKVGTLEEKRLYSGSVLTQTELYEWGNQTISSQNELNHRQSGGADPFIEDQSTYAPILIKKTIARNATN